MWSAHFDSNPNRKKLCFAKWLSLRKIDKQKRGEKTVLSFLIVTTKTIVRADSPNRIFRKK